VPVVWTDDLRGGVGSPSQHADIVELRSHERQSEHLRFATYVGRSCGSMMTLLQRDGSAERMFVGSDCELCESSSMWVVKKKRLDRGPLGAAS
jgi:hypothetical protein